MRELKTRDGKNTGSENAGLKNAAPNCMTGKRETGKLGTKLFAFD